MNFCFLTFAYIDRVYICGGFDGQECLQTAEYYNPITNQWTMIQPMRSRRRGVGSFGYFFLLILNLSFVDWKV